MKNKALKIILAIVLLILLCFAILIPLSNQTKPDLQPDSESEQWQGKQELEKPKSEIKQIAIVGLDSLVFIADQTEQRVNFYNPKENDCLMVFSLHIGDRELWRSGYCAPDNGYYTIELNEPLEKGTYKASLLHECFKQDGTRLNSANVDFDLIVQEE